MESSKISAVLLGAIEHEEFRQAARWLAEHARLRVVETIAAATWAVRTAAPDVIVVAQSRAGQFSEHALERVFAAAPLARLVGLLGGWCEGELRTGRPWPGVERMYWHQFAARMERELTSEAAGEPLARTQTATERMLYLPPAANLTGLMIVHAPDRLAYEALGESLAAHGMATVRHTAATAAMAAKPHGVRAALWECHYSAVDERRQLRGFVDDLSPAPVLVIAGFPRQSDLRAIQQAGAVTLLSKPFLVPDLITEIERVSNPAMHSVVPAPHLSMRFQRARRRVE